MCDPGRGELMAKVLKAGLVTEKDIKKKSNKDMVTTTHHPKPAARRGSRCFHPWRAPQFR